MTMLNGCDTVDYDKKSKKCRSCMNRDYCAFKKEQPKSAESVSENAMLTMLMPGISFVEASDAVRRIGSAGILVQKEL